MAKPSFKNNNNNNNKPTLESIRIYHLHTTVSCLDFINTRVKDIFALEFMLLCWAAPHRPTRPVFAQL